MLIWCQQDIGKNIWRNWYELEDFSSGMIFQNGSLTRYHFVSVSRLSYPVIAAPTFNSKDISYTYGAFDLILERMS